MQIIITYKGLICQSVYFFPRDIKAVLYGHTLDIHENVKKKKTLNISLALFEYIIITVMTAMKTVMTIITVNIY